MTDQANMKMKMLNAAYAQFPDLFADQEWKVGNPVWSKKWQEKLVALGITSHRVPITCADDEGYTNQYQISDLTYIPTEGDLLGMLDERDFPGMLAAKYRHLAYFAACNVDALQTDWQLIFAFYMSETKGVRWDKKEWV